MTKPPKRLLRSWCVLILGLTLCRLAQADPLFVEDSALKGLIFETTDTQSVAWVDFNGDGWQDLWLAGHQMGTRFYRSRLYLNKDGRFFENIWPSLPTKAFETDAHGNYWADYDNDGDQDLLVVAGGGLGRNSVGSPNMLLENSGKSLIDRAAQAGIANLTSRGRIGYWLDKDGDGKLDVMLINSTRPDSKPSHNQLYLQGEQTFTPLELGPSDLRKRGTKQLVLAPRGTPRSVGIPLKLTAGNYDLLLAPFPRRVVQQDLDGDGRLDHLVYAPPKIQGGVCHSRSPSGAILAWLPDTQAGEPRIFEFQATGPVKLNTRNLDNFGSWRGDTKIADKFSSVYLSDFDPGYLQDPQSKPEIGRGVRISRPADSNVWRIEVYPGGTPTGTIQFMLAPASTGITLSTAEAHCTASVKFPPYIVNGADHKRRKLALPGMPDELFARGIVAGDFDNDTDIDLYVSRGTPILDIPDVILLNNGSGIFTAAPVTTANSYKAAGIYVDEIVPGPHLVVGDYNNDGFLDLFQSASFYYSWMDSGRLEAGIPHRLLTNRGNTNSWLLLELEGTRSNRDAIGAEVRAHIGKNVQIRFQSGGIDSFDQHSKRLHFGLGRAEIVDRIEIRWPSGEVSVLNNVKANQVLKISEGS